MISVDKLIEKAVAKTGLSDFGGDDFREPLAVMELALNTESNMNATGAFRAEMIISDNLATRLQVEDYVKNNPEIKDKPVDRPIFIAGLPRTGTTALHHMLNADPANHTLRLWEGSEPVPPPEEASYTTDPRIEKRKQGVAMTEEFMPGFLAAHLLDAEAPDECHMLLNRAFISAEAYSMFHIPSYAHWVYDQDLTDAYAYHRLQLQLLQHKKSGMWVLKSPFHQIGLKAIFANYPDAIIVQPHRPPMTIMGSGCSFNSILRRSCADDPAPEQIGADWLDMVSVYTQRFEADRAELEQQYPDQFVDVYHDKFIADPWASIEEIYSKRGTPLSDEGRAAMQGWLDANPKGKHGKHEYKLEDYGISRGQVEQLFADYVERYDVDME